MTEETVRHNVESQKKIFSKIDWATRRTRR
jgi:hypothetical protein